MNGLYRGVGTGKQACRNDGKTVLLLRVQEYGLIELYILFQARFSCVFWLLQSAGTGKRQKTIMQSMTVKRTGFCRACEKTGQECRGIRPGWSDRCSSAVYPCCSPFCGSFRNAADFEQISSSSSVDTHREAEWQLKQENNISPSGSGNGHRHMPAYTEKDCPGICLDSLKGRCHCPASSLFSSSTVSSSSWSSVFSSLCLKGRREVKSRMCSCRKSRTCAHRSRTMSCVTNGAQSEKDREGRRRYSTSPVSVPANSA